MNLQERDQARREVEARRQHQRAERAHQELVRRDAEFRSASALANYNRRHDEIPVGLRELHEAHPRIASRLAAAGTDLHTALRALLSLPARRELEAWTPIGKCARTLFRSLAAHLLARYPVPVSLWNGFFAEALVRRRLLPMIAEVAGGGSLVEWVKQSRFPVPLTRKMCHEILRSREDVPLLHAIRRAQIRGLGGSEPLIQSLLADHAPEALGLSIGDEATERWWNGAVQWLANQALLDPAQVAPLCDYLRQLRREDPELSLKGRTGVSLLRFMEAWHHEVTVEAHYRGAQVFKPSGIAGASFDFSGSPGSSTGRREVWTIAEVLTARELRDEGQRQGHCVFSYAPRVESGACSIWTVVLENPQGRWAMLTLEVRNATRSVVQVRGRLNRLPSMREREVLLRWATESRLTLLAA